MGCLKQLDKTLKAKSKDFREAKLSQDLRCRQHEIEVYKLYIKQQNCLYAQAVIRRSDARPMRMDDKQRFMNEHESIRISSLIESLASQISNDFDGRCCLYVCEPTCIV